MKTIHVAVLLLTSLLLITLDPARGASAGATPTQLPVCTTVPYSHLLRFFFSPTFQDDGIVFARAGRPDDTEWQLFRSTDGGRSWTHNLHENISDLAFSPNYAADGIIYASRYVGQVNELYFLRSQDRGATWERLPTPYDGPWVGSFGSLVVESPDTLLFARDGAPIWNDPLSYGLYRFHFTDSGASWERLSAMHINDIALSPNYGHDQTLLIAAYDYKINMGPFISTDGGRSWASISNGIDLSYYFYGSTTESLLFAPAYPADGLIFAAAHSMFYRSSDNGASWQRVDPLVPYPPPPPADPAPWVLSPYFTRDRTAWIDYGRWITHDAGDTWKRASDAPVLDLAAREWCEGDRCGVLLLGRGENWGERIGVYKSFDLGRTWQCPDAPTPSWWPDVPPLQSVWLPIIRQ